MRYLFLFVAVSALVGCSDPGRPAGQAQQQQKSPSIAKVAEPPTQGGPVALASSSPALALDTRPPSVDVDAASDGASVNEASAEPAAPLAVNGAGAEPPPLARAINQADPAADGPAPAGPSVKGVDLRLVKLEVLLDRAGFSPGVIDGKNGQNLSQALAAYASAKGVDGKAVPVMLSADTAPAAEVYTIAPADVAGPFIGDPPKDYEAMAKLPALGYSTPLQALAEKFHMDQKLLQALNPDADWSKAGSVIVVAAVHAAPRPFEAARIEVDKTNEAIRVYDASNALVAYYPATVGSTERPAPSGTFKVVAVAPRPAYFYDPKRLTFTPQGAKGKLRIAPGPNNPVGATWIALNIPTYGIHGSPDPTTIGKRQSHGCVRLTNWDAVELGKAVKKGVKVVFVGSEKKA